MKIQTKRYGNDLYVVGFYPKKDSYNFLMINRSEKHIYIEHVIDDGAIIVDNKIDSGFVYAELLTITGIYHHYLVENPDFLLEAIESFDSTGYDEFLSVLIDEELIPPHFYQGEVEEKTALAWLGEEYRREWGAK